MSAAWLNPHQHHKAGKCFKDALQNTMYDRDAQSDAEVDPAISRCGKTASSLELLQALKA
jgi:hypothetical protein